jgi:acetate kinase
MGPPRDRDQIEVSRSDEFVLGVDAPVRISGDLDNTPGITVAGPAGEITLPHGLISARATSTCLPTMRSVWASATCETVSVRIDSGDRDLEFRDVMVRVAADFRLELHLDTDEANAAGVRAGDQAVLVLPGHDQSRISGMSSP